MHRWSRQLLQAGKGFQETAYNYLDCCNNTLRKNEEIRLLKEENSGLKRKMADKSVAADNEEEVQIVLEKPAETENVKMDSSLGSQLKRPRNSSAASEEDLAGPSGSGQQKKPRTQEKDDEDDVQVVATVGATPLPFRISPSWESLGVCDHLE